jgi:hypothetical protein
MCNAMTPPTPVQSEKVNKVSSGESCVLVEPNALTSALSFQMRKTNNLGERPVSGKAPLQVAKDKKVQKVSSDECFVLVEPKAIPSACSTSFQSREPNFLGEHPANGEAPLQMAKEYEGKDFTRTSPFSHEVHLRMRFNPSTNPFQVHPIRDSPYSTSTYLTSLIRDSSNNVRTMQTPRNCIETLDLPPVPPPCRPRRKVSSEDTGAPATTTLLPLLK